MTEKYTFEFNDGNQFAKIVFTDKKPFEQQVKELNEYLEIFIRNLKDN